MTKETNLDETHIECEAERQRVNDLQQATSAGALTADIQRLQQENAAQQAAIAEAEAKAHTAQDELKMTIVQLTKRTQVQLAVLNRERAQLLRRIGATKVATIQAASSLCFTRIVPHLRSLLATYDQGQEGNSTNHTSACPALAVTTRRPSTSLRGY
ncbi:hypothetical protein PHYSODRAFT_305256 [Phytophthora sojae]|uniref:Uncharacterized protein n=1 Tax=Phytophthora sojae (strain P6497) TaxID=1094619 RepID=G5A2J4_PHYSP|nr:hypothetical protein PHYSODRAFT_305256 [Phytophthora sojae]EGZ09884.1 hypothetical protein PHYSODRAFT_305256 [Phytophthora sojae]|eukprot:XP_009534745.1 hypothetical protein PHYSODRAFT_305256 [Phytophthora sojae]